MPNIEMNFASGGGATSADKVTYTEQDGSITNLQSKIMSMIDEVRFETPINKTTLAVSGQYYAVGNIHLKKGKNIIMINPYFAFNGSGKVSNRCLYWDFDSLPFWQNTDMSSAMWSWMPMGIEVVDLENDETRTIYATSAYANDVIDSTTKFLILHTA